MAKTRRYISLEFGKIVFPNYATTALQTVDTIVLGAISKDYKGHEINMGLYDFANVKFCFSNYNGWGCIKTMCHLDSFMYSFGFEVKALHELKSRYIDGPCMVTI